MSGAVRARPDELEALAGAILEGFGLPRHDAHRIASALVEVDLRGTFTHGTARLELYCARYRDGELNPRPRVRVVKDEPSVVIADGDGGLGYLPALVAVESLVEKAEAAGLAAAATRNHGHGGSLGVYARLALREDLISIAFAGPTPWIPPKRADAPIWKAAKAPALCIAVPAGTGPPLVLDMAANMFRESKRVGEAMERFPNAVVKSLGLRFMATTLGGLLPGSGILEPPTHDYAAARHGFLMIAFPPRLVGDAETFRGAIDELVETSLGLEPIPTLERADLPGSIERRRSTEWAETGIPLEQEHARVLEELASESGVTVPWG